jgi:hypothetical protein
VLDSVLAFDAETIAALRRDFGEVAAAMLRGGAPQ